jgi:hypothetical protein
MGCDHPPVGGVETRSDDDENVGPERQTDLSPSRDGDGLFRCEYDVRAPVVPAEKCASPHQPRMFRDPFVFEPDKSQALCPGGRRVCVRG